MSLRASVMVAAGVLAVQAWAQPKSAIEFYDTTGSDATARLGWQGPRGSGKLFVESPVGTELLRMQSGRVTVNGEVSAARFRGDGSALSGVADSAHTHTLAQIAPDGITSADIKDSTITTADIRDSAITSAKIRDGAVATADMQDSAVTSAKIRNGTIRDADIAADAAIAGTKIAPHFGYTSFVNGYNAPNAAPFCALTLKAPSAQDSFYLFHMAKAACPTFMLDFSGRWGSGFTYEPIPLPGHANFQFGGWAWFKGDVVSSGAISGTSCCAVSDSVFKRDVRPIENALAKVTQLEGVTFRWREGDVAGGRQFDERTHMGLIAQQVESVVPEVVASDSHGYKSLEYGNLVALLVEARKEQQALIAQQNARINQLAEQVAGKAHSLPR